MERGPSMGIEEPAQSGGEAGPIDDSDESIIGRIAGTAPGPGETDLSAVELEALLFVAERPLTRREVASLAGVELETVDARLGDLEVLLRDRGIRLLSVGDRVELATAPEAGSIVARYTGAEGLKLSPAALEALAIVAYRQPVTRGVVERIRGVDSDSVMRSLLHRRLIAEQGRADTPGRPILFGTSFEFLERFGLTSLDDLPTLDAETAGRLAEVTVPDGDDGPAGDSSMEGERGEVAGDA
jgi:segregation and condensation protein B